MEVIAEFITSYASAAAPWSALGVVLMFAVRLLRIPAVQMFLPGPLQWRNWSLPVKYAVPFLLAAIGTILPAAAVGQFSLSLLQPAFAAGLAAVALHLGTKAVGSKMTAAALAKDEDYKPSPMRRAISPVLPIDKKLIIKNLLKAVK